MLNRLVRVREGFLLPALLVISIFSLLIFHALVVLYSTHPLIFHVAVGALLSSPAAFALGSFRSRRKIAQMKRNISRLEAEMVPAGEPGSPSPGSPTPASAAIMKPSGYTHWLNANLHLWWIKEGFVSSDGQCQFCNADLPDSPGAEFDHRNHAPDCPLTVVYEDMLGMTNRFNGLLSKHMIEN